MQENVRCESRLRREFPNANWIHVPLGEAWEKRFRNIAASAFRLETLQAYAEPSEREALAAFQRDGSVSDDYICSWCEMVRGHVSAGKTMERVHLVHLPLSNYLRFEVEAAYVRTGAAGENILLLDATTVDVGLLNLLNSDFWILDDSSVMVQQYNSMGTLQHSFLTTDAKALAHFRRIRDRVLPLATPFADFWREHTGRVL